MRDGTTLVCPWHWYRFDLDTGACATNPDYRLRTYPVLVRDGARYADVGEPPPSPSWSERLRAHARGRPPTPPDDRDPRLRTGAPRDVRVPCGQQPRRGERGVPEQVRAPRRVPRRGRAGRPQRRHPGIPRPRRRAARGRRRGRRGHRAGHRRAARPGVGGDRRDRRRGHRGLPAATAQFPLDGTGPVAGSRAADQRATARDRAGPGVDPPVPGHPLPGRSTTPRWPWTACRAPCRQARAAVVEARAAVQQAEAAGRALAAGPPTSSPRPSAAAAAAGRRPGAGLKQRRDAAVRALELARSAASAGRRRARAPRGPCARR